MATSEVPPISPVGRWLGGRPTMPGVLWAALLGALLLAAPAAGIRGAPAAEEITNLLLSPGLNRWLVGPVYFLATEGEVERYMALDDDSAAEAFIEAFWNRREAHPEAHGGTTRDLFERRRARADTLFDSPPERGHQTDQGVVYVLFGEPDTTEIESRVEVDDPPLEVWTYAEPPLGLDGKAGRTRYAFELRAGDSPMLVHRLHR